MIAVFLATHVRGRTGGLSSGMVRSYCVIPNIICLKPIGNSSTVYSLMRIPALPSCTSRYPRMSWLDLPDVLPALAIGVHLKNVCSSLARRAQSRHIRYNTVECIDVSSVPRRGSAFTCQMSSSGNEYSFHTASKWMVKWVWMGLVCLSILHRNRDDG